jgi:hypothetical protein
MSAVNDDQRLWDLYADGQAGMAIGFDSQDPFLGGLLKVKYVSARPRIVVSFSSESQEQGREVAIGIISTKGVEWEYEQEYRVVRASYTAVQNQDTDPRGFPVYLFAFPPSAVQEVILGNRMAKEREEAVVSILAEPRYKHVRLGKVDLSSSVYKLRIRWLGGGTKA